MKADDLLVLLEVARSGSLLGAASALEVDHTTVSRRLSALERAVGAPVVVRTGRGCELTDLGRSLLAPSESVERAVGQARTLAQPGGVSELTGLVRIAAPDVFAVEFMGPAMARMVRTHPGVTLELTSATRPMVQGNGADIEIGVGSSQPRLETVLLSPYVLGLYGSTDYLADHGTPTTREELDGHRLVYYVESLIRVYELDVIDELFPSHRVHVASTSVHAQLTATMAGAGLGLLPAFLADAQIGLRRVLRHEVDVPQKYIAALAPRSLRRPATTVVMQEIRSEVRARQHELMGRRIRHEP
ncbi:LysR family transcriptional regulator [Nakamurella sp. YIM 132087]|uniref:LysR family transcriptional regulator n=1 Tax=Nakamurella alba TaxID=2665158 RepID=A0A7K1FL94_9ACTN|nr:LysR family transcriptional regulator [Nakamurella alba]